jgi:Zn-dependent peptidase ImmA (M78 family)
MKYENIIIPFVDKGEIKTEADIFRKKFWGDKIPVKIESIIEIKLKMRIIPIPNLFKLCSVDSQISSDFSSIWVDQDNYLYDETNRLYFSLAHELGHYVLHKELFLSFQIQSVEDVISFINNIPEKQYSFLEAQANKFASQILLPREFLLDARKEIVEKYKLKSMDEKMVNAYIADSIAKKFEVSSWAAELALEDLNNFERR